MAPRPAQPAEPRHHPHSRHEDVSSLNRREDRDENFSMIPRRRARATSSRSRPPRRARPSRFPDQLAEGCEREITRVLGVRSLRQARREASSARSRLGAKQAGATPLSRWGRSSQSVIGGRPGFLACCARAPRPAGRAVSPRTNAGIAPRPGQPSTRRSGRSRLFAVACRRMATQAGTSSMGGMTQLLASEQAWQARENSLPW